MATRNDFDFEFQDLGCILAFRILGFVVLESKKLHSTQGFHHAKVYAGFAGNTRVCSEFFKTCCLNKQFENLNQL